MTLIGGRDFNLVNWTGNPTIQGDRRFAIAEAPLELKYSPTQKSKFIEFDRGE